MKSNSKAIFVLLTTYAALLLIFLHYKNSESIFYLYAIISTLMYGTGIVMKRLYKSKNIINYLEGIQKLSFTSTVGFIISFIFVIIDFSFATMVMIILTMIPFTLSILKIAGYATQLKQKKENLKKKNKKKKVTLK